MEDKRVYCDSTDCVMCIGGKCINSTIEIVDGECATYIPKEQLKKYN